MGSVVAFWEWDASTQTWKSYDPTTSEIKPLNGYWVKMSQPAVLTLDYATPAMPSIPTKTVYQGWDTVGLTVNTPWFIEEALNSIDNSYSHIVGWNIEKQKYEFPVANTNNDGTFVTSKVKMVPKKGYWIWVTQQDELAGLSAEGAS